MKIRRKKRDGAEDILKGGGGGGADWFNIHVNCIQLLFFYYNFPIAPWVALELFSMDSLIEGIAWINSNLKLSSRLNVFHQGGNHKVSPLSSAACFYEKYKNSMSSQSKLERSRDKIGKPVTV